MKILTKYILKEITGPFLFSLLAFTSMFSGISFLNLLKSAERYHLSIILILKLVALRLPEYIMQCAPIAVLMATLLGLGSLTSHSETTAMRAGGFNYSKLLLPVLILGIVISITGVAMNEFLVPAGLRNYEKIKHDAATKEQTAIIEHFDRNFFDEQNQLDQRIYAAVYQPKAEELQQVTIEEYDKGKLIQIITTKAMSWNGSGWFFRDGLIYRINSDNFYPMKVEQGYVKYDLNITPKEIESFNEDPEQQSISELGAFIAKYYQNGTERQRLLVDYHLKFSIPFASLILAWMGAPLALRPQRRSNAAGYGLCIIFILLWYMLMGLGTYLGRSGVVTPFIGAWLPNMVLAGYGVYVSVKAKS